MLYHRAPRIILVFLIFDYALAQESDKQLQDVGLQNCIDGFVVHKDKIIRTQDSREMGAKYLTEFDVESRVECMKWCCETEHCDVFIFEEKKPGSCYLFHCGPPHDFKCKFTTHANYSSAVLTNYNLQSAATLEEQIRRNEQEHELKSLRKLDLPSKEYNYFTNAPPSTSTTPAPEPFTTSTTQSPFKVPICSRNQFECRSNDDCIAIYNVCDGIPQCADGSDEAAELGCPVDKTTMPPPPPPPPLMIVASPKPYVPLLPDVIRYQQMMQQQQQQQHVQYPMVYPGGHSQEVGKNWNNPSPHQMSAGQEMNYGGREYNNPPPQMQMQQQQQQQQLQQQQQQQSGPEDSIGPGMGQPQLPINYKPQVYNQWNNYQEPIYEHNSKIPNNNPALDVMHAQNVLPPAYEQEQPPQIFHHKGPAMRLEELEPPNGMYGQDPNRGYPPYYPGAIHHIDSSWQEGNNPVQPPQQIHVAPTQAPPHEQQQQPIIETKKTSTTTTSAPPCDPSEKHDDASKMQNNSDKKATNDEAQKRVHSTATKAKDNNNNNNLSETHENRPAPENIKADNHKAHEAELRTMADKHLEEHKSMAITDHIRRHNTKIEDLEMSRPKGAVISLALGLTVTAVMAVLIACRLRVVKRRGRGRGHDSYAHDADYLVNGMYL